MASKDKEKPQSEVSKSQKQRPFRKTEWFMSNPAEKSER
jgi:hypothetical protein